MEKEQIKSALIFCNRKIDVSTLTRSLTHYKLNAAALHGDLTQSLRTATLEAFKNGKIDYLVASDVAARGIDIEDLPHVINFDLPHNPEEYVHRVGRTGRAGRFGQAYSFVDNMTDADLNKFRKFIHQNMVFIDMENKPPERKKNGTPQQKQASKDSVVMPRRPQSIKGEHLSSADGPVKGFGNGIPQFFKVDYKLPN